MIPRLERAYGWPEKAGHSPSNIGHRGASDHATENTLAAYYAASALGADMWEIDIHLTADNQVIVTHDTDLDKVFGVKGNVTELTRAEIRQRAPRVPDLDEVIDLAEKTGAGLYIEIKGEGSGVAAWRRLEERGFTRAVLGSFKVDQVRILAETGCPYSLSVLVPLGADPFERAEHARADMIHLCWERGGERPQDLVTPDLIARAQNTGLDIVLWHEERAEILKDLVELPVLGICTNRPEMMAGFKPVRDLGISPVCHRGINHLAPENTLAAARLCFDQGADWLELDVRLSADDQIVVIHDPTLERTTNGTGEVTSKTLAELKTLDAGSWFSPFFAGETIPTLREMIELAQSYGRKIYIENKSVPVQKLLDFVQGMGFENDCFFWSGDAALQVGMREISQTVAIKTNTRPYSTPEELRDHLHPQIVELGIELYIADAQKYSAMGIIPMMQYFGDDPEVFDQIIEIRPPMLNLDRSDLLLAAARKAAPER